MKAAILGISFLGTALLLMVASAAFIAVSTCTKNVCTAQEAKELIAAIMAPVPAIARSVAGLREQPMPGEAK